MCHPTPGASKNVKFRLSRNLTKFDGVTRFRETNSTVKSFSSSEIYKIFGFQPKLTFYHFSEKYTTRKKLINDTFNASLKSYNDTSLKFHGLDCHCISLYTMTLISSVIFVNQNYDIHLKRHYLLIIFQSNNLTMALI